MHVRHLLAPALVPVLSAACCCGPVPPTYPELESAVVTFVFDGHPADTMRVRVDHAPTIATAFRVVDGRSPARIPAGPIERGAGVDPRWPFHFVPDQLRLVEVAMELCDGAPMRTPEEVEAFFAGTGSADEERAPFCPWSARPIRVE